MEMVEYYGGDDDAYIAANLYLKGMRGTTKTIMAKQLSEQTSLDYRTATMLIDAIDAYEDIRESFVNEDITDNQDVDYDDKESSSNTNLPHKLNAREYAAFIYGVEWGNSAQYNDGGYRAYELPVAYNEWVAMGRIKYYDQ